MKAYLCVAPDGRLELARDAGHGFVWVKWAQRSPFWCRPGWNEIIDSWEEE